MKPSDRIIVALDVSSIEQAQSAVRSLQGKVGMVKAGFQLLGNKREVPALEMLMAERASVMLDKKLNDIPNTMEAGVLESAWSKPKFLTIHANAGRPSVERSVNTANTVGIQILAVTLLTSLRPEHVYEIYGADVPTAFKRLAKIAIECGAHGLVCSPQELEWFRMLPGSDKLVTVVPGVRPIWAAANDQARVMTPADAVRAGADYLVIGRPILEMPEEQGGPREAVRRIVDELAVLS